MTAATLEKAALEYAPSLNVDGRALAHVLSQCDGSTSTRAIVQSLRNRYADRYHSPTEALSFVQRIVKQYG